MITKESFERTGRFIVRAQTATGAIPWFEGGTLDPWDHVEAAMGLSVGGFHAESKAAYLWLAQQQRVDGSWLAAYQNEAVVDGTRAETNFVAYIATGVWHHYLVTGNRAFLAKLWPTVKKALEFVIDLQTPSGEIYWAVDTRTGINKDALITGCSSIHKSLECCANIAEVFGEDSSVWLLSRERLGVAIRHRPERFDRTWEKKSCYAMDWFYPILTGVVEGRDATKRLEERWDLFVEPGLGCRCVAQEPWVTTAESCELTMACLAADQPDKALDLFRSLSRYQAEDGSWWTGYAFADEVMWPDERPTWTAGAVMLAADALEGLTGASCLFTSINLPSSAR